MASAASTGPVMGQSGLAMLPRIRFVVERAHYERGGVRWLQAGDVTPARDAAEHAADRLRKEGWRVRVRPLVL